MQELHFRDFLLWLGQSNPSDLGIVIVLNKEHLDAATHYNNLKDLSSKEAPLTSIAFSVATNEDLSLENFFGKNDICFWVARTGKGTYIKFDIFSNFANVTDAFYNNKLNFFAHDDDGTPWDSASQLDKDLAHVTQYYHSLLKK